MRILLFPPLLVVTQITPSVPRLPYKASEAASFNTVTLSISSTFRLPISLSTPSPRSADSSQRASCPENDGSAYSAQANARPSSPNVRLCLIRAVHHGRALSRTAVFGAETPVPVVPTKQNRSFRDIPGYCKAMIKQNRLYEGMKKPRPRLRMNPPQKVGARIRLPGFRTNGYESPFHRLLKLPHAKTSVHRKDGREQGLPLVYAKQPRGEALTSAVA